MALVDPARDPQPYLEFAEQYGAKITTIFETHPHADFVSSHLEISKITGATIYVSQEYGAAYPHKAVMHGTEIKLGDVSIRVLFTPGHSPDSISLLLIDEKGNEHSLFSGDTLFVGDVGRPDLRENAGNITATREKLASAMYATTREIIMMLEPDTLVYPAHGAGSLCGKSLSPDLHSTIGRELSSNYALQPMDETQFVGTLLADQPFMPKYFGYDVELNKNGAPNLQESLNKVARLPEGSAIEAGTIVVDIRAEETFKSGHLKGAWNIQEGGKFETWVGSIVAPHSPFYLVSDSAEQLETALYKLAKIGYESFVKGLIVNPSGEKVGLSKISISDFEAKKSELQIIDVRNHGEYKDKVIFPEAKHIPLPELIERASEIDNSKPVVVHCAAGYRSAAAQSILKSLRSELEIYDISDEIKKY
jgi:glyoxylase-like metal-dependent hydrolase (beta-lactamase superfamily II)/rhodanese-related sulfurtransferase